MPDYPYTVPEGYTEGMSGGSYDPDTGERKSWALPPAPRRIPTDMSGMAGVDWNAVQENIKNHGVEAALKATAAAIQFQGQRGYQQALKNGEPAEKAIAKFGPMMFYQAPQAFGPSVRALTPPTITPQNAARNAFEERRVKLLEQAATQPKPVAPPVVTESVRQVPNPNILTQRQTPILSLTNRTTKASSPQTVPAPQTQPTSSKRVRVKGPGNAKGTVLEGTKLPEGWSFEK